MADKRIIDYTEAASAGADYYLVTDSASDGVKKIKPANIVPAYTGDVTSTAGGTVNTIAANAVTNAKAAQMPAGTIKANLTGALASASDNTINAVMDAAFGSTQGAIAYRGASGWSSLAPGASGQFMQTSGPSANPIWQTIPGGGNMLSSTYDPTGKLADAFDSANTKFLQLGTGAVARALQDRGRDTVNVKDYGAKGDSIYVIATLSIASGAAALTATGATFTAADVGKTIVVPGAGAAGAALHTTISAFTDATHVTLAATAGTTLSAVTGKTIYYGTDNYTAITNAYAYCVLTGKTLEFPSGSYGFSAKIEFATMRGRVIASAIDVTLQFFGTGVAISWNGASYNPPPGAGVYRCEFGGAFGFLVQGNPDCTHLVLINQVHASHFKYRGRDCTGSILKVGIAPVGASDGCVLTTFDVCGSGTQDYEYFAVKPGIGADINGAYACIFEKLNIETVGAGNNYAVSLTNVQGCTFKGGSVENNVAGAFIDGTCARNVFIGMHNEVNGSITPDWTVYGSRNTFIGCHGKGTTGGGLEIHGSYNVFQNSDFAGTVISSGATSNKFERCDLSGTITDGGTNTVFDGCTGIADSGSFDVTIANGGSAVIIPGTGYYEISVAEYNITGNIASYLAGNGTATDVKLLGGWVATTTTPAAGQFSIAGSGGSYKIFNNQGASCKFAGRFTKMH